MKTKLRTIETKAYEKLYNEDGGNNYITFRYMLPFRLPLEDETVIELEGFLFLFLQREYEFYGLKDSFGNLPIIHTIVEGTVTLKRPQCRSIVRDSNKGRFHQKSLTDAFDAQLNHLNKFMKIINIKYQYLSVYPVHVGEITGPAFYKIYRIDNNTFFEAVLEGFLMLKEPTKLEAERYETLDFEDIEFIVENFAEFESHRTSNIALIARRGERAFDLYDYNNTIVHYNTVFEVIIKTFIRDYNVLLKIKSKPDAKALLEAGLRNLVDVHFPRALDGINLKDSEIIKTISKKFMTSSYLTRNDIVHEGKSYSEKEAVSAMELIKDLTYMINDSMHKAQSNPFVDMYTKYNMNYDPSLYETIKSKYK